MENRLAIVGIMVKDKSKIDGVNTLLHEFSQYNKGRLGLPCEPRGVSVICIVIDAPMDIINALTGKLGMIGGIKVKTLYD